MARTVSIPDDAACVLDAELAAGRFPNAGAVVSAAFAALVEQRAEEAKLAALRDAIAKGDESPDAPPGLFERLRARHGLPSPSR